MEPIFNIFFWIKWLWIPWTVREQCMNSDNYPLKQNAWKKKKCKSKTQTLDNLNPSTTLVICVFNSDLEISLFESWKAKKKKKIPENV